MEYYLTTNKNGVLLHTTTAELHRHNVKKKKPDTKECVFIIPFVRS